MTKIAFLFPGQGAQSVGMARSLLETLPAAQHLFAQASAILGYDLAELCLKGPAEKLDATAYSQPALYVASLAALEWLKANRPELVAACQATAGLSLGEYSALAFAGALDFEDGLRVVQLRGQAMQEAADLVPSGMVSVLGLEADKVQALCDASRGPAEVLQLANYLCPGNIACSGHKTACERLIASGAAAGAKTVPLSVAGAFHTSLMQPAVERLAAALAGVTLRSPRIPVVSNVDAQPHSDPEEIRALLVRQVVSPVRWEDSLRKLLADGCTTFWEVGPGRVLRGTLKRVDRKAESDGVEC